MQQHQLLRYKPKKRMHCYGNFDEYNKYSVNDYDDYDNYKNDGDGDYNDDDNDNIDNDGDYYIRKKKKSESKQ